MNALVLIAPKASGSATVWTAPMEELSKVTPSALLTDAQFPCGGNSSHKFLFELIL